MKRIARLLVLPVAWIAISRALGAQITALHSFSGEANGVMAELTLSGSVIYGAAHDSSTLFKMNVDGSGFTALRTLSHTDGATPIGRMTLSGSALYGVTFQGGPHENGAVFKINTDGSGYTILHAFNAGANDGQYPDATLLLSGSTLYGTTALGGASAGGTVFKLNIDGTGFTLLHTFPVDANHVSAEAGGLTMSGTTLYGVTGAAEADNGTLFSLKTDGNDYTLLHAFGSNHDRNPGYIDPLVLSGSTLYGTTDYGGANGFGNGTVYKINTDGTGYGLLHGFDVSGTEGAIPLSGLALSGPVLYGMTTTLGPTGLGTLFQVNTDGTGFSTLHDFGGGAVDGAHPNSGLVSSGLALYGVASRGGLGDDGLLFALSVPEPSTVVMFAMGLLSFAGHARAALARFCMLAGS